MLSSRCQQTNVGMLHVRHLGDRDDTPRSIEQLMQFASRSSCWSPVVVPIPTHSRTSIALPQVCTACNYLIWIGLCHIGRSTDLKVVGISHLDCDHLSSSNREGKHMGAAMRSCEYDCNEDCQPTPPCCQCIYLPYSATLKVTINDVSI